MTINLSDIKLTPDLTSVFREKISDEEYFSEKYRNYISNSRLKLINPKQDGSPTKYKNGFDSGSSQSLIIGSAVHQLFLQPESFILGPNFKKPSAKLGEVIDSIKEFRNNGYPIDKAIIESCKKIHYYENNLNNNRIKFIIKNGLEYYLNCKSISENTILLSEKNRNIVVNCVKNLNDHNYITRLIRPSKKYNKSILTFNEDAFFIKINANYFSNNTTLSLKMKADNWSIDLKNKIITLNDLKTTGHFINDFMDNSFIKFHYNRQFAMYLWILLQYCKNTYGYNSKEWKINCNVIVVETIGKNKTYAFSINNELLNEGRIEFCNLLKRVAYCEMFGYDDSIDFI